MSMAQPPFSGEFRDGMPFLGGSLWIDFVNSKLVVNGAPHDLIATESGVAHWARQANIAVPDGVAFDLPGVLQALRTQLAVAFDCLAASQPLAESVIATINHLIARSAIRSEIAPSDNGALIVERLDLVGPPVATAVAWDFARFLGRFENRRMRHCDNPACVMQFYDIGKNNRRRWCTMSLCGNRDKVAHYRGRKSAAKVG